MKCISVYLNTASKKVAVRYSRRFLKEDPLVQLEILTEALRDLDERYFDTNPRAFGEMEITYDTSAPLPPWHLSYQQVSDKQA